MSKPQSMRSSVNKGTVIGFNITTSDATSTDVITAANVAAYGDGKIREIYLLCTLANGWLGMGKTAAVLAAGNVGVDLIPIIKDAYIKFENCNYAYLTVIRVAGTDTNVTGYVVVH